MNVSAAFSLVAATAAEVTGIIFWYDFLQQERYLAAYVSLVGGESVEFLLLGILIVTARDAYPRRSGRVGTVLRQTGLVLFSESLLWFLWAFLLGQGGLVVATAVLFMLMHIKHTAAVSFFHGRQLRQDILDIEGLAATVLEVGGATGFYLFASSGHHVLGMATLALAITIEHSLQFKAAGVGENEQRVAIHS